MNIMKKTAERNVSGARDNAKIWQERVAKARTNETRAGLRKKSMKKIRETDENDKDKTEVTGGKSDVSRICEAR